MATPRTRTERPAEAAVLAAVGGFLDAYTYLAHDHVFANAQTGNVVLFAVDVAGHHWAEALRHVWPLIAFVGGMLTVEVLSLPGLRRRIARPTRLVLLTESAVFLLLGLLPRSAPGIPVTVAITWASTLQVGTFRRAGDASYNTTFTTGNIRSLVSDAFAWLVRGDAGAATRTRTLGGIVAGFAAGALLGGLATVAWHTHAVIAVVPALLVVLASLIAGTRRIERARAAGSGPA